MTPMTPETSQVLPHQSERLFLTDGGLETSLVFLDGEDLPLFAAFTLLRNSAGRRCSGGPPTLFLLRGPPPGVPMTR